MGLAGPSLGDIARKTAARIRHPWSRRADRGAVVPSREMRLESILLGNQ
jgi:hypothetical protein